MGSNLFPNLIPTSSQKWHCYSIMKGSSSSMVEGSLTELQLMVRKQRFLLYQTWHKILQKAFGFLKWLSLDSLALFDDVFADVISFSRKKYFSSCVLVFVNFFTENARRVCVQFGDLTSTKILFSLGHEKPSHSLLTILQGSPERSTTIYPIRVWNITNI